MWAVGARREVVRAGAVLLLGAAVPGCAAPVDPPPVCARQAVLQVVNDTLRERGHPLRLAPLPFEERSTDPDGRARCAVQGFAVGYDTTRFGERPVYAPFVVRYIVEQRRNGWFVQVE